MVLKQYEVVEGEGDVVRWRSRSENAEGLADESSLCQILALSST